MVLAFLYDSERKRIGFQETFSRLIVNNIAE